MSRLHKDILNGTQTVFSYLPCDFEDYGVPNSFSFRNGKYIMPGSLALAPPISQGLAFILGNLPSLLGILRFADE